MPGDPGLARDLGHDRRPIADPCLLEQPAREHRAEDPLVAEVLADRRRPGRGGSPSGRDVPVPHGDRSIAPVHVAGRSQSSAPVETVTTLRIGVRRIVGRPGQLADRDPGEARLIGMDDRQLVRRRPP